MKRRIVTVLSISLLMFGFSNVASAHGLDFGFGRFGFGQELRDKKEKGKKVKKKDTRDKGWWDDRGNRNRVAAVPEIDPASAVQAVALLSGGLLVMRGRRRSEAE